MNLNRALCSFLEQHFPNTVHPEPQCTCGAGNHARVCFFRVNDQPATAVIPEGAGFSAAQLAEAVGSIHVRPLQESELDAIYAESELGLAHPFENPFGTTVYFDQELVSSDELVFCPRMFFGQRGECFRAPTKEFLNLLHPIVVPLTSAPAEEGDDWAV